MRTGKYQLHSSHRSLRNRKSYLDLGRKEVAVDGVLGAALALVAPVQDHLLELVPVKNKINPIDGSQTTSLSVLIKLWTILLCSPADVASVFSAAHGSPKLGFELRPSGGRGNLAVSAVDS